MILRAQKINHESPERFHSVWNSCTSNVLAHLGHVLGKKLPISRAHYLTDTLDTYLAQHGLLDLKEPYSRTVRTLHCINEIAKTIPQNAIDFSSRIRL
jgi:hypothetical protein